VYILAYDFGTGGIKASLYGEDGACVASGFDAYPTTYPASGFHEQAPEEWWRATVQATHRLTERLEPEQVKAIRALGISGHSLGVVPLDAAGNLLRPTVPIWSDARAGAEAETFFREVPEEAWYMKTGNGFPPALYSVFKLMWFRAHEPGWFGRAVTILGTKDYINFRLCGVRATDHSYASGTGVYDLASRRYDDGLMAASGLPRSLFPEIVPATQVLGTLTADAARELGLPRDVKVVTGGVDNSCMALGAGAWREGRAYCSLGSSAWIAVSSAKPLLDPATRPYVFDHVVPGQYASALAIFSAGTAHTWCRDVLCDGMDYAAMDAEAAEAGRGAHDLYFNPSLAGGSSLDPTPALRGAFANLDLRHTRGDVIRAVMEGVAFGLKRALDELTRLTCGHAGGMTLPVADPLTLVGGGANSSLWRQIYADVYGRRVARAAIGQQAAALGAALVAGVGAGVWPDFSILDSISRADAEAAPDPESATEYARRYARWRSLTDKLGEWAAGQPQSEGNVDG